MSHSRALPRTVRFALYALALGGGALYAHISASNQLGVVHAAANLHQPAPAPRSAAAADLLLDAPAPEPLDPGPSGLDRQTQFFGGRIIEGSTPHRLIFFTFDDGPDIRTTPLLLDRLDAVGVKAAFFLTASRIAERNGLERTQAGVAREIARRGHLIGNHTLDHRLLPALDDSEVEEQVVGAEDLFQRVLGFRPVLLRPPGGGHSPRIDALLAQRGYTTVLWNIGGGDFQVTSAREVFDTFVRVLAWRERQSGDRGGIVLLHDTYSWSVDAFQLIWAELWNRNCRFLAQGEELYDIVPDLSFFFEARAGAGPDAVASPARLSPELLAKRQRALREEAKERCSAAGGF